MAPRPKLGAQSGKTAPAEGGGWSVAGQVAGRCDVLIVSLGSTGGLRVADGDLLASLRRAGAHAELVQAQPPRALRTLMLTDMAWARAARRAALAGLRDTEARALIYSSTTAALLWPRPGAIRFDAPAAGNRRGRHGLWQRPLERRRLREASLLLPLSEGGLRELPTAVRVADALVLPAPVEPSSEADGRAPAGTDERVPAGTDERAHQDAVEHAHPGMAVRDIAAITYAANPAKKGLNRILEAWVRARRPGEELIVAGVSTGQLSELGYALPSEGVRVVGMLAQPDYRALLRRARAFVCAARREDYGAAQLEALIDGCVLVTSPSAGPYVALPIARTLDARLVGSDLAGALRIALDDPVPDYAQRALEALAPYRRAEFDRLVAEQLLPRLLGHG